jgi:hypothetical protein
MGDMRLRNARQASPYRAVRLECACAPALR